MNTQIEEQQLLYYSCFHPTTNFCTCMYPKPSSTIIFLTLSFLLFYEPTGFTSFRNLITGKEVAGKGLPTTIAGVGNLNSSSNKLIKNPLATIISLVVKMTLSLPLLTTLLVRFYYYNFLLPVFQLIKFVGILIFFLLLFFSFLFFLFKILNN